MLDLAIAARYVSELLGKRTIARYLDDNHPEMAKEFRSILSATLAEPSKKTSSRKGRHPGRCTRDLEAVSVSLALPQALRQHLHEFNGDPGDLARDDR
ncbi:hypothetical protein [Bradyrhizobium sp. RT11b]|uniref:hypothetical protein n=1 Tax=Bradyrhizobium sp. RT11b TaxID=3156332 RepID=UPI0033937AED